MLHFKCTALSQSESSISFTYIIIKDGTPSQYRLYYLALLALILNARASAILVLLLLLLQPLLLVITVCFYKPNISPRKCSRACTLKCSQPLAAFLCVLLLEEIDFPGLKVKFLTYTVDQGKMTPRTLLPTLGPTFAHAIVYAVVPDEFEIEDLPFSSS